MAAPSKALPRDRSESWVSDQEQYVQLPGEAVVHSSLAVNNTPVRKNSGRSRAGSTSASAKVAVQQYYLERSGSSFRRGSVEQVFPPRSLPVVLSERFVIKDIEGDVSPELRARINSHTQKGSNPRPFVLAHLYAEDQVFVADAEHIDLRVGDVVPGMGDRITKIEYIRVLNVQGKDACFPLEVCTDRVSQFIIDYIIACTLEVTDDVFSARMGVIRHLLQVEPRDYKEVAFWADLLMSEFPRKAEGYLILAKLYFFGFLGGDESENIHMAETLVERARSLNVTNTGAMKLQGQIWKKQGKTSQADALIRYSQSAPAKEEGYSDCESCLAYIVAPLELCCFLVSKVFDKCTGRCDAACKCLDRCCLCDEVATYQAPAPAPQKMDESE